MPDPLPSFPSTLSIPPACFYTSQGLAGWLNNNPTYKQFFPDLLPSPAAESVRSGFIPSSLSSLGYTGPEKIPLCTNVTTLSQQQASLYNQQLILFYKVYTHNSNAYVNYAENNITPIYYNFANYKERTNYLSAVSLINKLYPFKAMSEAPTLNWQIPFPIYG